MRAMVFDLGGVLVDWDPRHLYRDLFHGDEEAMEAFLADVCNQEWNAGQDAGRSLAEATEILVRRHPDQRELIEAYYARWPEMLRGVHEDTLAVLAELRAAGIPLYALTNWSAETFPVARQRFEFLSWFRDIVVSGEVGLVKPDRRVFELLMARSGLSPADLAFTDDHLPNVEAAAALGITAFLFRGAERLRQDLASIELLPAGPPA